MTLNPNCIQIAFNFSSSGSAEILQNLHTLFTTPKGTVALDRDFGIDFSILDNPLSLAQNLYSMEIAQKVTQYEPRAKVESVEYQQDNLSSSIIPKVVISYS